MKKATALISLFFFLTILFQVFGQSNSAIAKQVKKDFLAIDGSQSPFAVSKEMFDLLREARHQDVTAAEGIIDSIVSYAKAHGLNLVEAKTYTELAEIYRVRNQIDLMIETLSKSIAMFKEFQAAYPDSLRNHMLFTIGGCYNNIADGYVELNKNKEALNFYKSSLETVLPLNDSLQNSIRYYNISDTYVSLNQPDSALKYILLCKRLEEGMNTPDGLAYAHNGLAKVHALNKEFELALGEMEFAIGYADQVNDPYLQVEIEHQKAKILLSSGDLKGAKEVYLSLLDKSKKIGHKGVVDDCYENLKTICGELKQFEEAFNYAEILISLADSAGEEKAQEKALEFQTLYQTELKDAEIKSLSKQKELTDKLNAELSEKRELEKTRSSIIMIGLIIGLLFLLIIGGILFFNSRKKVLLNGVLKKSNEELSEKNTEIQQQASEINDSIAYAMNIQGALLPNHSEIEIIGQDRFVLFSPKDIVSGDFYWTYHSERLGLKYIAVADCTGHGVPGAFMSILGISLLDKIVIKLTDLTTNRILTELNSELYKNLSAGGQNGVRDGMDIALIAIDEHNNEFHFSGVRNRVIHITEGLVKEYKGDRIDLGRSEDCTEIKMQTVTYKEGDQLYLFTDGFLDQKGGELGKKFYIQPFRSLLQDLSQLPMDEQVILLRKTLEEWIGTEYEQMDDILVIGIKL